MSALWTLKVANAWVEDKKIEGMALRSWFWDHPKGRLEEN